jgi:hypothetical protein
VPSNAPRPPASEHESGRFAAALGFNLVVVGLLLALVVVGGKVHKLLILSSGWRGRDLLAVLGSDFGYLLLLGGAIAIAVTLARGIWSVAVKGFVYLGLLLLLLVGLSSLACGPSTTFVSSWRSPKAEPLRMRGERVAAVVMMPLRPLPARAGDELQASAPCTGAQTFDWAQAWVRHVLQPEGREPVIVVGFGGRRPHPLAVAVRDGQRCRDADRCAERKTTHRR